MIVYFLLKSFKKAWIVEETLSSHPSLYINLENGRPTELGF